MTREPAIPGMKPGRHANSKPAATATLLSDPSVTLPSAVDMERCALSCLMQAPDFAGPAALRLLVPDDFSLEAHGLIYDLIAQRYQGGKLIDVLSITQELYDRGQIEKLGGPAFVSEIYTASPNAANFEHYAREVLEKAMARRVVTACLECAGAITREPTGVLTRERAGTLMDAVLAATIESDRAKIVHIGEAIADGMQEMDTAIANRGHVTGEMATGFTDLDRCWIRGVPRGETIVIAGDTSMGKTSLAVQIIENIATGTGHYKEFYNFPGSSHQHRVDDWQAWVADGRATPRFGKQLCLLVCLESSQTEMALKMLMGRAGLDIRGIHGGMIARSDIALMHRSGKELQQSALYIWDAAGITVEELCTEVKQFKLQHPELALVCVDHCGLLGARAIRDIGNETAVAGYVSNTLQKLWKMADVAGLELWQLNREAAAKGERGKRPTRADLRSSGKIEQNARKIVMPYRPWHYDQSEDIDKSEAFLIIAKNTGGPINLDGIPVRWEGETTRFYSEQKDEDGQWRPRHRLFSLKESEQQVGH
jgi:replicative DNA helicase